MSGNKTNKDFYKNVPLSVFQGMTEQGGFSAYKDLKLIANHIPSESTVLELGAGYGRCVDFLLQQKHTGLIVAVEQSEPLFEVLRDKYSRVDNVNVLHEDLMTMKDQFQAGVVLWIFSGLLDFAKEEQLVVLKKIRSWVIDGGKVFIDIPQLSPLTIARYTGVQDIVMETAYGKIETFLPSQEDMKQYAIAAGFSSVAAIDYDTDTEKKRTMFILQA